MRSVVLTIILLMLVFGGAIYAQDRYRAEINEWRARHEAEQNTDDGWLTVVGLFWLKDGKNTIGSGSGYDIELTDNFKAGRFGEIDFQGGKAVLRVANGVDAAVGGKPATTIELTSDENGKPSAVTVGSQTFYLIKREERFGIRLKDSNSKARRDFTHLNWYAIDPKLRVTAKFEKYPIAKDVLVPNVLGGDFKMKAPGLLKFELGGKPLTLEPVDEGDGKLFIIFRDLTSTNDTYGAGRFLYAEMPTGDTVVLDFNKAENPPCAFTSYATCPLPPQQNRLQIEIRAGEKRYARPMEK